MQGQKVSVQSLLPLLSYYYDDDDYTAWNGTQRIQRFRKFSRVRQTDIGRVWRAVVDHGFVYGVRRLVGKDAGRQAADQLLHLPDATALHHVVVHQDVLPVELDLFFVHNTRMFAW